MLPIEFTKLIGTGIKLNKILMEEEKKVQVRKLSSTHHFFYFLGRYRKII